jgi:hypothetical protein
MDGVEVIRDGRIFGDGGRIDRETAFNEFSHILNLPR